MSRQEDCFNLEASMSYISHTKQKQNKSKQKVWGLPLLPHDFQLTYIVSKFNLQSLFKVGGEANGLGFPYSETLVVLLIFVVVGI